MGTRLNGYKRLLQKHEANSSKTVHWYLMLLGRLWQTGVLATETRTECNIANQQILCIHFSVRVGFPWLLASQSILFRTTQTNNARHRILRWQGHEPSEACRPHVRSYILQQTETTTEQLFPSHHDHGSVTKLAIPSLHQLLKDSKQRESISSI